MANCGEEMSLEAQAELVKDIKRNVASLKTSIDQILLDMNSIRLAKLEILEKFGCVRSESIVNSEQLQATLGKAKRVMRKSEENQKKLEIVLKKMNKFNIAHSCQLSPVDNQPKPSNQNINVIKNQERIKLLILNNNKYSVTDPETDDNEKSVDKKKESALRELQWIVKMKLYKLRHHYDKLGYDLDLEERTPLPLSWRRS